MSALTLSTGSPNKTEAEQHALTGFCQKRALSLIHVGTLDANDTKGISPRRCQFGGNIRTTNARYQLEITIKYSNLAKLSARWCREQESQTSA